VITIGKIGDIFAHQHTGEERKGASNDQNLDLVLDSLRDLAEGGLVFANLVDFDSEFGHRRDVPGYAACLEAFDRRLPALLLALRPDDLLVITADHGNDPTFEGTDHTREHVPVLLHGASAARSPLGRRDGLARVGDLLARHLGLPEPGTA
jgi:phosphopentomutase